MQARSLLGGVASSTYHAWKTRPQGKQLDQDTLTRISLVIGIYKALNIYFNKPLADRWITFGNRGPMFAGMFPAGLHDPERPARHARCSPHAGCLERWRLIPPVQPFHLPGMHRLISSKYSRSGTVLEDVTNTDADLATATALDAATNDRVLGETRGLAGISPFELVYGFPNAHIIRAAFLHPNKAGGSRFNDTTRGAWYAAEEVDTCIAEVSWHRARRLSDIIDPDSPGQAPQSDSATYDDWQADFHADFHVLEAAHRITPSACSPNPFRSATRRRRPLPGCCSRNAPMASCIQVSAAKARSASRASARRSSTVPAATSATNCA